MHVHGLLALAIFAGAGVAAALTIRETVTPNLARIQSALAGQGAN